MRYKGWTCEKHRKGREKLMNVLPDRKNVLYLQQHAYPASRKNSALRVSFLFYIPMATNKIPYPKHLISFTDQINLLKQRGMVFGNEPKALHLLQNISYYRLSGYWYPLLGTNDSIFSNRAVHLKRPITSISLTVSSAN